MHGIEKLINVCFRASLQTQGEFICLLVLFCFAYGEQLYSQIWREPHHTKEVSHF